LRLLIEFDVPASAWSRREFGMAPGVAVAPGPPIGGMHR